MTAQAPTSPPTSCLRAWAARLYAAYLVSRGLLLFGSMLLVAIVTSALIGAHVESAGARLGVGLAVAALLPLVVRWRLCQLTRARFGRSTQLGGPWFLVGFNLLVLVTVCLGFGDGVGRALRRRGDWFLGQTEGWLPRQYRQHLALASRWLERFDLPADLPRETRETLLAAARPQPPPPSLPAKAENGSSSVGTESGPSSAGVATPPAPQPAVWFHPLAGPRRVMPPNAACRFGAPRPGPRPRECELGHCGVDLFRPAGTPVLAAHEGTVHRIERDADRGGIAGRYVVLSHGQGAVFSSYVHLEEVRSDLTPGMPIRGGEPIGTLGSTGTRYTAPHLHFAVGVEQGARKRYIDPEPLLWVWHLPEAGGSTGTAVAAARGSDEAPHQLAHHQL